MECEEERDLGELPIARVLARIPESIVVELGQLRVLRRQHDEVKCVAALRHGDRAKRFEEFAGFLSADEAAKLLAQLATRGRQHVLVLLALATEHVEPVAVLVGPILDGEEDAEGTVEVEEGENASSLEVQGGAEGNRCVRETLEGGWG